MGTSGKVSGCPARGRKILRLVPLTVPLKGTSLIPLLPNGCQVSISPCTAAELRVGDLVAYETGEHIVLHQLVAPPREGAMLTLRAFSRFMPDPPIHPDDVIGRATRAELSDGGTVVLDSWRFAWGSRALAATWRLYHRLWLLGPYPAPRDGSSECPVPGAYRVLHGLSHWLHAACLRR